MRPFTHFFFLTIQLKNIKCHVPHQYTTCVLGNGFGLCKQCAMFLNIFPYELFNLKVPLGEFSKMLHLIITTPKVNSKEACVAMVTQGTSRGQQKANRRQLAHRNLLTFNNDHFNANQHKITLFTMGQSGLVYSILHPLQSNIPKTKLAQTRTISNFNSPSHFTKTI